MNVTMAEERREVGVAEKMMVGSNYAGARDLLIKVLQCSPATESANQMMIVCDILSAASIKFPNFGIDYYWLLQLSPLCSESDINYRYHKLIKALQSTRYKIHGARLAGKLIRDAFSVLSDPLRRCAYDMKRADSRESYRSFSIQTSVYYGSSDVSLETSLQSSSASRKDNVGSSSSGNPVTTELSPESDVQNQEPGQVLDDMSSRENVEGDMNKSAENSEGLQSDPSQSPKSQEKSGKQDYYDFDSDRQNEKFEVGQIWGASFQASVSHKRQYARVENNTNPDGSLLVTWLKPLPISSGERRWCEAGLPVACGSFEVDLEMRDCECWPMILAYKCSWFNGMTDEQFEIYPKRGEIWAVYKDWDLDKFADSPDDLKTHEFDYMEMLSDFSKYIGVDGAYLTKVDGFKSIFVRKLNEENRLATHIDPENLFMFSHLVPAYRFDGREVDGVVNGMLEFDQSALPSENSEHGLIQEELEEEHSKCYSFTHTELPTPVNSYSEYQCLSPCWSQFDFYAGQVWAVFCYEDYMPRKYVVINAVVSANQISVTHLVPLWVTNVELGPNAANNPAAYGIYKVGDTNSIIEISHFSHLAKCQKSTNKPFYRVLPHKGEVWAVYRNWNNKWKLSDYARSPYGVVEVLAEYSDVIIIAKLEEVKGCLTFYQRKQHDGFQLTNSITKSEIPSFSHQIPAYKVPGIERYKIPADSWHLDPCAIPPKHNSPLRTHVAQCIYH